MQRWTWVWAVSVALGAALVVGCGKPALPGSQFRGARATLPGVVATDTPLPKQPIKEWGPKDAKVRIVAFFPIDEPHKKLMGIIQDLVQKYPGKVYAKYVDYRTPEGEKLFGELEATTASIYINGKCSADLQSTYGTRTVDFVKEMGRFWTEDDLRQAVAAAVAAAYGKQK